MLTFPHQLSDDSWVLLIFTATATFAATLLWRIMKFRTSHMLFFSLTEAPLTDPTPTPPNTPETDPKRTRNRPETEPNRTEPNGAEMDRNQALSGGTVGGFCRDGGVWARELGTICPFGVFPLFYSNFWPNLSPIHVARQIVVIHVARQIVVL